MVYCALNNKQIKDTQKITKQLYRALNNCERQNKQKIFDQKKEERKSLKMNI